MQGVGLAPSVPFLDEDALQSADGVLPNFTYKGQLNRFILMFSWFWWGEMWKP
jgi:hypothetical protein